MYYVYMCIRIASSSAKPARKPTESSSSSPATAAQSSGDANLEAEAAPIASEGIIPFDVILM